MHQGEVLARMITQVLNEQRPEAAAQIKGSGSAVLAAEPLLDQRQSEMRASEAVGSSARRAGFHGETPCSLNALSQRGAVSAQQLDDDRAAAESARGGWNRRAQVSARAAIEAARTSIIQAQTCSRSRPGDRAADPRRY